MSLRLVRRLLQQTAELGAESTQQEEEKKEEIRRKKRNQNKKKQIPVDEKDVIQHQINSLLFLDRKVAAKNKKKDVTVSRIRENHLKEQHTQKSTAKKVLGNTRSSTSELKKAPIPTFNKKIYQKHKEEKRLAQISRLLKKNTKSKATK